MAYVLGK